MANIPKTQSLSFFLFGPRGSGKSTLLKKIFAPTEAVVLDLLEPDLAGEYQGKQFKLSYLRVNEDLEIDVIIERGNLPPVLAEIKSANRVDERHAKGLLTLGADFKSAKKYLISNDPHVKGFEDVLACPLIDALQRILDE